MRILVLGGYGLIGASVVRHLIEAGHHVIGLGRAVRRARLQWPEAEWIEADIARLTSPAAWQPIMAAAIPEAIVNCAGALQDGARDDVAAVQATAMIALYAAAAAAGIASFVQISAPRADAATDSKFMRSKGEADAALRSSALDWTILRPGLVFAPQAYGGTAMLRALAALPLLQPLAHAEAPIQTVHVNDVARAVVMMLDGSVPTRRSYDLVEDHPRPLAEVVARLRSWLGHAPAPTVSLPSWSITVIACASDGLGWLGWRPPLRSTALAEINAGVIGDPAPWRAASGTGLPSFDTMLRRLPSTIQERWFARAFVVKPLAIAMLSIFWIVTGLVALGRLDVATQVLRDHGATEFQASAIVVAGSLVDLALGIAIALRATTRIAALGMLVVTAAYVAGGTVLAPDLWLDPLGPLLKALPAAMLAVVTLALDEER